MGIGPIIWGFVLPACVIAGWHFARRPLRQLLDGIQLDQARLHFRHQRERLEAKFMRSLSIQDPIEALRWEEADWLSEVRWARDRHTHGLLALVGVQFGVNPFDDGLVRHATVFFEYRKGLWIAEGKYLNALRPEEALRHRKYEAVLPPDPRV